MNETNYTTPMTQSSSPPFSRGEGRRVRQRGFSRTTSYDPIRRLVAAVAMQAICDLTDPKPRFALTDYERYTALFFLARNRDLYLALGIPDYKLSILSQWIETQAAATLPQEVPHVP